MDVLLLDSHSLLHACTAIAASRQFLTPRAGPFTNQPIGPSFIFVRSLLSILKDLNFPATIAVFDGGVSPWRLELLSVYKRTPAGSSTGNLVNTDKLFEMNRNFLRNVVLPSLEIPTVMAPHVEADDLIAYIALNLPSPVRITIASADADFDQLLRKGTRTILRYDLREKKYVTSCAADEHILYKCLTGCRSDNIPGVGQIGQGRAKKFLEKPTALRKALTPQQQENFRRNYQLISLPYAARKLPAEIREPLDHLIRQPLGKPVIGEKTKKLFKDLEWNSVLKSSEHT